MGIKEEHIQEVLYFYIMKKTKEHMIKFYEQKILYIRSTIILRDKLRKNKVNIRNNLYKKE
jgi:hypothetical protein